METGVKTRAYWNLFGWRINKFALLASLAHFFVMATVNRSGGLFISGDFEVGVPLPLDTERIGMYQALTWIISWLVLFLFYQVGWMGLRAFLQKDKAKLFNFVLPFGILFAWYFINLKVCDPGLYNIDDRAMYALARHFLPYYWQSYLTSLFYMVGLWLFQFQSGQIVMLDIMTALVFAYFYYRLSRVLAGKKGGWVRVILLAFAVSPFINIITLYCFRPYLYSMLNLLVFGYLIFEKLEQKKPDPVKLVLLALGFAVLAFWRTESIIYLFFAPFLVYFAYAGAVKVKQALVFAVATALLFGAVNLPQSMGNKKYYGSDYLIVSTIRPLSVLLNLDETYNYEGVEGDVESINTVINAEHIKALPFTCTAYQSWNGMANGGRLSETMVSARAQSDYLKAFLSIVKHNPGNWMKERADLFIKTNMLDGVFQVDFGKEIAQTEEPYLADYWIFQAYVQDEGFSPGPIQNEAYFNVITARGAPANMIFAIFPYLVIILITLIFAAVKKSWLMFLAQLIMLLREVIIFLTSPDVMIYYYMPSITLCVFISLLFVMFGIYNRKAERKVRLLA